jgi:DNA-binding GntR family transcriptional regulator
MNTSATTIAQLRELQALTSARADMLEESRDQERTRAEGAEAELRELRKAMARWADFYDKRGALADAVLAGDREAAVKAMGRDFLLAGAEIEKELRSHA